MAPYEALSRRKCRSPVHWYEAGRSNLNQTDLTRGITKAVKIIQWRLENAHNRQKSYADKRRRPLEFQVGDAIFLKVSPLKGVMRFEKKGKLSPRYVGSFEITKQIRIVAYKLALSPYLSTVHNVFHLSMLKTYLSDPSHVLTKESIEFHEDRTYEEKINENHG